MRFGLHSRSKLIVSSNSGDMNPASNLRLTLSFSYGVAWRGPDNFASVSCQPAGKYSPNNHRRSAMAVTERIRQVHALVMRSCLGASTNPSKLPHGLSWATSCEIVIGLKIDPELRCRTKGLRQEPSRLRRYPTLPTNQLVHPLNRHTDMLGKGDLGHTQRFQELLK